MAGAERIVVAMSGGVDSSVAAALVQASGAEVIGVTLRLQRCDGQDSGVRSCCGVDAVARASAVAGKLGVRHYVVDAIDAFEARVLQPAWETYAAGRTPSPCLWCNERIKFGFLLEWAQGVGAAGVATGHYARVARHPSGRLQLLRGHDPGKDQTYFLAGLTGEQLAAVRFPLGEMRKEEVRSVAARLDLPTAQQIESQDACLVGAAGEPFAEVLRQRYAGTARQGVVVNDAGEVLGPHAGLHLFTIGQRRGLGLSHHRPMWVAALDVDSGTVQVVHDADQLVAEAMLVEDLVWSGGAPPREPQRCTVQVRYRHRAVAAEIAPDAATPTGFKVRFDAPVRAVTPGQAAVFYDGDAVLGRGWIVATA